MRCPDTPRALGLPKDTWWRGQQSTIDAIIEAFVDEGKKYVLLGSPTGSGKTIIAAAVQKLLGQAGIGGGDSLVLTHTIALQRQYIETLTDAHLLIGRRNFACDLSENHPARFGFPKLTAADAPCATDGQCDEGLNTDSGCGYYRQRGIAAKAPMVVTNYAMAPLILQSQDRHGYNPYRRGLLVADECHLSERAFIESAGAVCTTRVFFDLNIMLPGVFTKTTVAEGRGTRQYETTAVWVMWAREHSGTVSSEISKLNGQLKSLAGGETQGSESEARNIVARLHHLNAALNVMMILRRSVEEQWQAIAVQRTDRQITVQPLWGWDDAPRLIWRHFQRVLLMSATPGDPDIERRKLGIPAEEMKYIERPSIFPISNRPVFYWPVTKLNFGSPDAAWEKIARAIIEIARQFPTRKGLVHSGSAANASKLVRILTDLTNSSRYFTHEEGGHTREEALREFIESPDPRVLVTASFTTGLDLPYLIGWQVIAKVPFGSLADELTARRRGFVAGNGEKFGQKVYQAEAMNTVVQAAGRIVRTPDDSGPTFILDGNYAMLHAQAYAPKFYREAYQRLTVPVVQ